MARKATAALMTVGLTAVVFGARLPAQGPHEISVYALVDVGAVAVPAPCSCIASPFTLMHPSDRGPSNGPAAPLGGTAPLINFGHLAEDRTHFTSRAQDGLSGNGNASLGVAMHLSLESALAGVDLRTEEEAARWLHLAATQEHPDAFRLLAWRYARGRGVPENPGAAAYWFHQGALRGDPISMTALGLRYAAGLGVAQDWNAAVRWWMRAQARTPLASRFIGDAYACGLGVAQEPARAAAAYKAAADAGELSSSTQLGHLHARLCIQSDDGDAVKAYRRAAEEGDPEAQIALSDLLQQGRGTDPNPYEAYTWARLAELRLPEGSMKARAADRVRGALRQMRPEAVPAQEALVQSLIRESAKSIR